MLDLNGIISFLNQGRYYDYPLYQKYKDVYYGMSLHIDGACPAYKYLRSDSEIWVYPKNFFGWEYQRLFEVAYFATYPTEADETRQWRFSQYKPFTQDPMHRCIQTVMGSIFQDSGYSVSIEDKDDNDYIWGDNFNGKNLVGYFQENFQNICNDPNGVFLTIPKEPRFATTTSRVEPHIYFIPSRTILRITKDEIIFNGWDEYTWAVNSVGYFRFAKGTDGNFIHVDAANGGYYAHLMGRVPIMKAGGIWNTQGFYDSWLNAAKAIADEYIGAYSGEQLVMKDASHPYTIMASTQCADCTNGQRQICSMCSADSGACRCNCDHTNGANLSLVKCASCGGTGEKSRNPGDRLIAPVEDLDKKLVQITSQDTSINKLHMERNEKMYLSLMRALHLNYIDEAQSGKAKEMDMQTRYQFILAIANDMFDRLLTGAIKDIISLRNVKVVNQEVRPSDDKGYVITKPTQFQIKTTYDLLNDLKEGGGKLPNYMLAEMLEDFGDKQFGGNDVLKYKTRLINQLDMLSQMLDGDISIAVLNGAATQRDWQFHLQLPKIIDSIIRDKGEDNFLSSTYEALESEINTRFAKIIPPVIQTQPTTTIDETRVNV